MAEEITSSGSVSAMPTTPETPATGTTSQGATPEKHVSLTLEEARARIAELERHASNKAEEASRHGKNLSAAEKKLAEYEDKERQAQEATLSEIERSKKQAVEAQKLVEQYKQQLITAQVKIAAQALNIIDPELAAMAVQGSLEYGNDGLPTNVDDALKALIKNKPYLAPKSEPVKPAEPEQPASPAPMLRTQPAIPAMNPGRSSIVQPNSLPPGKIPSLSEAYDQLRRS